MLPFSIHTHIYERVTFNHFILYALWASFNLLTNLLLITKCILFYFILRYSFLHAALSPCLILLLEKNSYRLKFYFPYHINSLFLPSNPMFSTSF